MARLSVQQKLGKNIRKLRKGAGLSQEKLGEITGLNQTYISDIELGKRNPSIRNIEKVAKALNVTASELI